MTHRPTFWQWLKDKLTDKTTGILTRYYRLLMCQATNSWGVDYFNWFMAWAVLWLFASGIVMLYNIRMWPLFTLAVAVLGGFFGLVAKYREDTE